MRCVISLYYDTFKSLEEDGKLDPLNEIDLFCLHKIYLPRINASLATFVESWNNHPLSSERNMTPNQLFIRGALEQNTSITDPINTQHTVHTRQAADTVDVSCNHFQPCASLELQLQLINPLFGGDYFSTEAYLLLINTVGAHLSSGCSTCS